jgi:hypothetical protein
MYGWWMKSKVGKVSTPRLNAEQKIHFKYMMIDRSTWLEYINNHNWIPESRVNISIRNNLVCGVKIKFTFVSFFGLKKVYRNGCQNVCYLCELFHLVLFYFSNGLGVNVSFFLFLIRCPSYLSFLSLLPHLAHLSYQHMTYYTVIIVLQHYIGPFVNKPAKWKFTFFPYDVPLLLFGWNC